MGTVAVAGGTGKLGLTICQVLKENPQYNVVALSRKDGNSSVIDWPIITVDYSDVDALQKALESNNIDTVISAIKVNDQTGSDSELNLVKAASRSKATNRFISSDWSIPAPEIKLQLPYNKFRTETRERLRKTELQWTTVHVGQIMDPFGTPHIKSHLGVYSIHVDMENRAASIPGTGNDLISFTYSFDLALFVEAALGISHWDHDLFCYSDARTYNEVLQIAETVRGSKFTVTYDPIEKLQQNQMTELPFHASLYSVIPKAALQLRYARFGLYCVLGLLHLPEENSLNKKFPELKTKKMEDIIGVWKDK